MSDARAKAEALYRGEGLECPPAVAASNLQSLGEMAFATRAMAQDLYSFNALVDDWSAAAPPQPYVAFGLAGHGLASFAVHYYALDDLTAVALQVRWGSAFGDAEETRKRYAGLLRTAAKLTRTAAELQAAGRFPKNRRIAVAHSDFHGSRWAWLDKVASPGSQPAWHPSRGEAMIEAMVELSRLARGETAKA
jgi:hypothetical protein